MSDQPAPDLMAICDICMQPVGDGDGHVWADQEDANTAFYNADDGHSPLDFLGLTTRADLVAWRTTHTICGLSDYAYKIEVERIRTWSAFLHWSAHLADKKWNAATDWQLFILRALEPKLGAVSGLRPVRPQDLDFDGIGA
ncbi:hypothetical protein QMK19_00015 [Streptomyces sp. H10-C2]|uniref:hypothetical protein n=1 Tax=unclassified Streptomyces TaxID=2593676 RepID=UPI0024BB3F14|nr:MULTISPECIES: hypothetical protein [unclassified Streptomyces]MDJ0340444.1 hypothetical protein [Streptomyces sp. PH10-H1]MDJ0368108.1 hypothetical protein [Streptomyces sp. H10-C2]